MDIATRYEVAMVNADAMMTTQGIYESDRLRAEVYSMVGGAMVDTGEVPTFKELETIVGRARRFFSRELLRDEIYYAYSWREIIFGKTHWDPERLLLEKERVERVMQEVATLRNRERARAILEGREDTLGRDLANELNYMRQKRGIGNPNTNYDVVHAYLVKNPTVTWRKVWVTVRHNTKSPRILASEYGTWRRARGIPSVKEKIK